MKRALLLLALMPLLGCEGLKRLTEGRDTSPGASGPADDYTVRGTTVVDYQIIEPVRCAGSDVTVRVKRTGEDWHDCNKYEVHFSSSGVGGGGVEFRSQVRIDGGILYINHKPVAPMGTAYEIHSVRREAQ